MAFPWLLLFYLSPKFIFFFESIFYIQLINLIFSPEITTK